MNKLGKLSIRLFAIYFFCKAIMALKGILFIYMPQHGAARQLVEESGYIEYIILHVIVMVIIAVLLWLFADNYISFKGYTRYIKLNTNCMYY